jgi:hypothetical protein
MSKIQLRGKYDFPTVAKRMTHEWEGEIPNFSQQMTQNSEISQEIAQKQFQTQNEKKN